MFDISTSLPLLLQPRPPQFRIPLAWVPLDSSLVELPFTTPFQQLMVVWPLTMNGPHWIPATDTVMAANNITTTQYVDFLKTVKLGYNEQLWIDQIYSL